MRSSIVSGIPYAAVINFTMLGEPITPSSASYSVYDNAGNVVSGLSNQPITISSGDTSATIIIPGVANTKSREFDIRSVKVSYIYNSITITTSFFYTIEEDVLIPVDFSLVRSLAQVTENDLADSSIDLLEAYKMVEVDSGIDLQTIISVGGQSARDLSYAIACKAAINSLATIQSTIFKKEQADNTLYERFDSYDLNNTIKDLASLYSTYLARSMGVTPTSMNFGVLALGTDAVTGD